MSPDDLDDNLELDSSTGTQITDGAASQQVADGASSSDAHGAEGDSDLLSVVRDAVDASRKPATDAASPADGDGTGEPGDDQQPKKVDDENFSDVPFNKHPRFQQLVRQRNEFRQDAERYRNVQGFLDSQGLSAEETVNGLILMGLMKTDPAKAWPQLRPIVENVMIAAGELLPQDLMGRVQRGEITQDMALELSRAQAGQKSLEARMQFDQQRAQQQQMQAQAGSVRQAVVDWEADRQAKDPNFAAKIEPLQKEIAFLQRTEGLPPTAEGVRDQLNRAYAAVNKALPPKTPAQPTNGRRPVAPLPRGAGAANARPEAMSTLDIIRANRA